jgi:hypothetical protein
MVRLIPARNIERQALDIDKVRKAAKQFPPTQFLLVSITASALISNFRWQYTWAEAWLTGTTPGNKSPGLTGVAYSVSELSNGTPPTTYAYGVSSSTLPAGFAPVKIPNGTFVMIVPHRKSTGELTWLIINTQALDGSC